MDNDRGASTEIAGGVLWFSRTFSSLSVNAVMLEPQTLDTFKTFEMRMCSGSPHNPVAYVTA